MPRETIELPYQVEYLSILDEDGELDSNLEPDLEADQLLDFHRLMLLARRPYSSDGDSHALRGRGQRLRTSVREPRSLLHPPV